MEKKFLKISLECSFKINKIMENQLINFEYNGMMIPFALTGNDVMINATQMAKPFRKRIIDWKRLPSTQEYLNALLKVGFSHLDQLIVSEWGGSNLEGTRGTWMHRLVAIEFARWLSPEFSIWCNMKIDEIINQGYALRDAEIQRLQGMVQSMQPQVDYYSKVLTGSENLYSTEQVCKELGFGISPRDLLGRMESQGIIYRRNDGKWFLSKNFDHYGYFKVVTILDKKTGKPRNLRRWTEGGKYWIWSLAHHWGLC